MNVNIPPHPPTPSYVALGPGTSLYILVITCIIWTIQGGWKRNFGCRVESFGHIFLVACMKQHPNHWHGAALNPQIGFQFRTKIIFDVRQLGTWRTALPFFSGTAERPKKVWKMNSAYNAANFGGSCLFVAEELPCNCFWIHVQLLESAEND